MTRLLSRRLLVLVPAGLLLVTAISAQAPRASAQKDTAVDEKAVERTRKTVKLLDDLNKFYVVTITDTYVKAQEKTPAATVAKKVFTAMAKAGHGTGRLIDASGTPLRDGNVAKTAFEKRAVAAIKGGKPYIDEVGTKDGKPVLRAATVVPAVMAACVNCHPHVKQGEVLGALVYEIPIQ